MLPEGSCCAPRECTVNSRHARVLGLVVGIRCVSACPPGIVTSPYFPAELTRRRIYLCSTVDFFPTAAGICRRCSVRCQQDKTTAPQTTTKKCLIAFGEINSSQSETALCSAVLAQSGTDAIVSMIPWPVPGHQQLDTPSESGRCLAHTKTKGKCGSHTERRLQAEALHIKIEICCSILKRVPGRTRVLRRITSYILRAAN